MGMQIHRCQLLIGDFDLGGIEVGVEVCLYSQPRLSCRRPNEIDNDLVAYQGRPRQFIVMCENRRCSILFHLLVPGG